MTVFYMLCSVALFAITHPGLFLGGIVLLIVALFLAISRPMKPVVKPVAQPVVKGVKP